MTSPNLAPDGLPYVTAGTIWDGVTEYHDAKPPGVGAIYILRMYGDGTRRFSEFEGLSTVMTRMRARTEQGWKQIGVSFQSPFPDHDTDYRDSGFLAYDGTFSTEPVNQTFYTNNFRAHAARYAQHLNATLGFDALAAADEWKRLVVKQTLSALLGSAQRSYNTWDEDDPAELIVGGAFDGTFVWKRYEQHYKDIHTALCGECELDLYAQEFYFEADLAAFKSLWRQGIIYSSNHDTTPWSPQIFDVANQADQTIAEYHDELDANYHYLLRHYAQVTSVQDRSERI